MHFLYLFLFTLSCPAASISLAKYQTSVRVNHLQEFRVAGDKVIFEKRTNYFDRTKDQRVGLMKELSSPLLAKKVSALLNKLVTVDRYLKTQGTSFDALTSRPNHAEHFLLSNHVITLNSELGKELEIIFMELQSQNWIQDSGIEISNNKVKLWSNGAVSRTYAFDKKECRADEVGLICEFPGSGIVYVR